MTAVPARDRLDAPVLLTRHARRVLEAKEPGARDDRRASYCSPNGGVRQILIDQPDLANRDLTTGGGERDLLAQIPRRLPQLGADRHTKTTIRVG